MIGLTYGTSRPEASGKADFTIRANIILYNIIDAFIITILSRDKSPLYKAI